MEGGGALLENLRAAGTLSIEGLRRLYTEALKELTRSSGFALRKAAALKAFVNMVDAEFSGSLEVLGGQAMPAPRARLLELPGVGPETADAILLHALGHPAPMADEYLRRIVERHRLLDPAPEGNARG